LAYHTDGSEIIIDFADEREVKLNAKNTTLAQTLVQTLQQPTHGCTFVMDRHKEAEDDFYQKVNGTAKWTDASFPTWDAHYFADGGSNETGSSMVSHKNSDTWHRISEESFFNGRSLFGS
jgi:hypothetical protein